MKKQRRKTKRPPTDDRALQEARDRGKDRRLPLLLAADSMPRPDAMLIDDLNRCDIDYRYQRNKEFHMVADLSRVLKSGGIVPDPISVARRIWDPKSNKLWIVDGQQRFWAHVDAERSVQAWVYDCLNYEQEVKLFHILNNRKKPDPNVIIRGHTGPFAQFFRQRLATPRDLLSGLVDGLGPSHDRKAPFMASTLSAMCCHLVNGGGGGNIHNILSWLDCAMGNAAAVNAMNRLLDCCAVVWPKCFPERRVPFVFLSATAVVCREYWNKYDTPYLPTPHETGRLQRYSWSQAAPKPVLAHRPAVVAQIKARWKNRNAVRAA